MVDYPYSCEKLCVSGESNPVSMGVAKRVRVEGAGEENRLLGSEDGWKEREIIYVVSRGSGREWEG